MQEEQTPPVPTFPEGFQAVESSAFRAVRWTAKTESEDCKEGCGNLEVIFHAPKKDPDAVVQWIYLCVPDETFKAMLAAAVPDSPGKFFAREVKGKFQSYKLPREAA